MSPAGRMEFCPEGEPSREDLRRELAALRRRVEELVRSGAELAEAGTRLMDDRMNRGLGRVEGMHARVLAGAAETAAPAAPDGRPAAWAAGWREGWESMDEHLALQRVRGRLDLAEREVARRQAIIEGRAVPPTDEEIEAHAAAGGKWRVTARWGRIGGRPSTDTVNSWAPGIARLLREQEDTRWWATDADDVLCDWPTARTAP